jgi:hypothetical protein
MKTFLALLLLSGNAIAQTTTTYVNQYGQPVATVQQIGATTFVSNQYGQLVGSATTLPAPAPVAMPLQNVLPVLPILPMIGAPR